jgi:type I restriction enzyme S subunit
MKQYTSYKDSGVEWIGEIPVGWDFKRLGFGIDTIVPMRDKPKELSGEIPWVRIEDKDGMYITKSKTFQGVSRDTVKKMNLKVYPVGTVLCTCSCSFGTTLIVKEPMVSNQTFIGLVPKLNILTSKFIFYLMGVYKDELERLSSGSVQQYLSRDHFKSLKVLYPPLQEQKQISDYLDRKTQQIDSLIERAERKIELLREQRVSIINQAVTKGLDPNVEMKDSGVEWIGAIPKHWTVMKTKYLVDNSKYYQIGDGDHGSIIPDDYLDQGIPYIRVQNLSWNGNLKMRGMVFISEQVHLKHKKSILLPNDIVIAKTGATVGKLCMLDNTFNEYNTTSSVGKITIDNHKHYPRFFLYYFQSKPFQELIFITSIIKSAQPGFNIDDLTEFIILAPSLREQKQIAGYLDKETDRIDSLVELESKRMELLEEYRQSLISNAVTGKMDVRGMN